MKNQRFEPEMEDREDEVEFVYEWKAPTLMKSEHITGLDMTFVPSSPELKSGALQLFVSFIFPLLTGDANELSSDELSDKPRGRGRGRGRGRAGR